MERSLLWKFLQIVAEILTTEMFDFKVHGLENIPKTGGVLLVANHQSYLDPVLVSAHLSRPVSFMARSDLFDNPWFGRFIRKLHAFPVQRGKGDMAAMRECMRRLEAGEVLNLYPEGTRTEDGEVAPLQKGISLLLRKISVPVVPVAIDGSFEAWPHTEKLFHSHPICLMYGKPMYFKDMPSEMILQKLHESLCSLLKEVRSKNSP
jgi:1-acyl-sn-glycerol-3-phosphate acyltransferase